MTIIDEFGEYDHFVTVILVSVILVLNIGQFHEPVILVTCHIGNKTVIQVRDNGHFSCELTIISVKITVILVYDNGHLKLPISIIIPSEFSDRTRTE